MALRPRRRIVGHHVALDAAILDRGEVVARRPDARGELLAEQIALGGEAFERHVAVVAQQANIVLVNASFPARTLPNAAERMVAGGGPEGAATWIG